ncbi:hypothetical protein MD588_10685 [Photobacterium sp. SDRW27]|uniref:hypothetical protein n=1 Tax=Photobacterium obscurum TaxID=2829490 RepID=UPI0022432E4D|nr:hypothetical protein [Photobacterium obscurum]MCW8329271.1 hypothetical protein [Photobacterium obscurum]
MTSSLSKQLNTSHLLKLGRIERRFDIHHTSGSMISVLEGYLSVVIMGRLHSV